MKGEALKMALDWAEKHGEVVLAGGGMPAVTAMNAWAKLSKAALAQPAQEPVAWAVVGDGKFGEYELGQVFVDYEATHTYWENRGYELVPVYTTPPQRPWVGLTEEDFSAINQSCFTKLQAATSAESILKEKNT